MEIKLANGQNPAMRRRNLNLTRRQRLPNGVTRCRRSFAGVQEVNEAKRVDLSNL